MLSAGLMPYHNNQLIDNMLHTFVTNHSMIWMTELTTLEVVAAVGYDSLFESLTITSYTSTLGCYMADMLIGSGRASLQRLEDVPHLTGSRQDTCELHTAVLHMCAELPCRRQRHTLLYTKISLSRDAHIRTRTRTHRQTCSRTRTPSWSS